MPELTEDLSHAGRGPIDVRTAPDRYRHWRLRIDDRIAALELDVDESGGLAPGYELKLNSYDLGVDIELADAVQRLRFEHPEVAAVVIRSGRERVFCAGANIRMLGGSSHAHKVAFCKFTNETRCAIEDASAHSGQRYLCAINGSAAGGGYELAMAADWILLVDDGSSAVSLPEVALLGVLPGTGGLVRVVDKRKVRRDRADFFSTTEEGVRGRRALAWGLVDEIAPSSRFGEAVEARAQALAATSDRPAGARGIRLRDLERLFHRFRRAGAAYREFHVLALCHRRRHRRNGDHLSFWRRGSHIECRFVGPRRRRLRQRLASTVLDVVAVRETQRHRAVEIGKIAARGGDVV